MQDAQGQIQWSSSGGCCQGRPDNIDTSAGLIDRAQILGRILSAPAPVTPGFTLAPTFRAS